MLRKNRYMTADFISEETKLRLKGDEILISSRHDIVIGLESEQISQFEMLRPFLADISRHMPWFDNEMQDFYSTIECGPVTFSPAVVYVMDERAVLDYWCEDVNSQFTVEFIRENSGWRLKRWNRIEVASDWRKNMR